jgi:hypothetical protein
MAPNFALCRLRINKASGPRVCGMFGVDPKSNGAKTRSARHQFPERAAQLPSFPLPVQDLLQFA